MKTIGIVAEYNPFHNGHAYLIQMAKILTGADRVAVVMSGDFVQRGMPAITDKYVRAQMAVMSGADLVLELPICAAAGSAEYFAQGAVRILNALGCVDTLAFGCENPDLEQLLFLADFFGREPEAYKARLQKYLAGGKSFPAAREAALKDYLEKDSEDAAAKDLLPLDPGRIPSLLGSPNNILAVEYLRALNKFESSIEPLPVERTDTGFYSPLPDPASDFSSAHALRKMIMDSPASWKSESARYIPSGSHGLLPDDLREKAIRASHSYDLLLPYCLLSAPDLAQYLDLGSDLAGRIRSLLPMYRTADRFVDLLRTKQMTEGRIRRALLHVVLGITKEDAEAFRSQDELPYARILAFRKEHTDLLHEIRRNGQLQLISKSADAKKLLTSRQLHLFEKDMHASQVYNLLTRPADVPARAEITRSPVAVSF